MKYTIHGFSQAQAIKFNLDSDGLLLLRWFVDFQGTNEMDTIVIDKKPYYWVHYPKVIKDMPIISDKEDTVYRKFKKLVKSQVLKIHTTREKLQNGKYKTYAYYGFGDNYKSLVSSDPIENIEVKDSDEQLGKKSEYLLGKKSERPLGKKSVLDRSINKSFYRSINNNIENPTPDNRELDNQDLKNNKGKKAVIVSPEANIIIIKFKEVYETELDPQLTQNLINEKGLDLVNKYLGEYIYYIKGREIVSLAADFYNCVMTEYKKPVGVKKVPQHANFDQRKFTEEDFEQFYTKVN